MALDLTTLGIDVEGTDVLLNAAPAVLVEKALANGECVLTSTGAINTITGAYTGRSPKDRFIVDTPDVHDKIAWGSTNVPFTQENYEKVKAHALEHLSGCKELYVEHARAAIGG